MSDQMMKTPTGLLVPTRRTTPRLFASVRAVWDEQQKLVAFVAVAQDGTAWYKRSEYDEWQTLGALPPAEG